LTAIPKQIYKLTKLKELDLDANNIDSISIEIRSIKTLESVSMMYNKIKNLEFLNSSKCEFPNLKYMYFGNNLIQNIPTNIELYKNLKIISIEDN
jgi:Leucine-rich repeat (LRR) protein